MQEGINPYDFIMDSGASPKRRWLPLPTGGGKKQRLLFAFIAGGILLLIFGIIFSLLFSSADTTQQTLKMAQQHKELLRVSEIGVKKSRSDGARNLATTVKLTLQSSEDQIVAIAKKDQKLTNKELSAGKNEVTDQALATAEQTNRFDEAFIETIHAEIRAYLKQLKIVYDASSSKSDKLIINDVHTQLNKLLPAPVGETTN